MCSLFSIDFAVACSLELCTFQDLFGQPSLDFDDTFINVTQYLLFPLGLMSSPHITVFSIHNGVVNTSPAQTYPCLLGGIKCQIFLI